MHPKTEEIVTITTYWFKKWLYTNLGEKQTALYWTTVPNTLFRRRRFLDFHFM